MGDEDDLQIHRRMLALVHESMLRAPHPLRRRCRRSLERGCEHHPFPREEDRPPPPPPARERCAPCPDLDFLPHKYALILCEPLVEEGYFVWPLTKSPMTFGFREREGKSFC
jgi:hypothetical protein